ncbi:AraC family transcriptional regulator [Mesorhizobium sp. IMUNJ 23232]|uniref:AraC family transcriptional regulator n=1 Tax=Mesorhizobium sp. IMUNJ 23232 TaxID=3376064 RepID=UPI0037B94FC6
MPHNPQFRLEHGHEVSAESLRLEGSGTPSFAQAAGSEHPLVTSDLDEIQLEMTRAISHHVANPNAGVRKILASKAEADVGNIGLIHISYGAEISINADTCGPHLLVQTPLSGTALIQNGNTSLSSDVGMGAIIRPDLPIKFEFSSDFDLMILRLSAQRLERHCAQLLTERGSGLDRPLSFALGFSLAGDGGARWRRLLQYLREEAFAGEASLLSNSPLAMASFDQMLMSTLLTMQPHNYTDALLNQRSSAAPFHVRRAMEFIQAHAAEPIGLVEIANAAGVSARTLHRSFQSFRGTTPLSWLKALRLQHAHDDLAAAEPATVSVTEVALKWGFGHLGHFSQDYRLRFGESPIDTLKRTR